MKPVIDGQTQPRPPEIRIDILDGVGVDRRLTPPPLVFELSGFEEFVEAGGWPPTQPMDLP